MPAALSFHFPHIFTFPIFNLNFLIFFGFATLSTAEALWACSARNLWQQTSVNANAKYRYKRHKYDNFHNTPR